MAQMINYPAWLGEVNVELSKLTNGTLSAEDFDYPWIEEFMKGMPAARTVTAALEADGFIVEGLPSTAMKLADTIFPFEKARQTRVRVCPAQPGIQVHVLGNRDPRGWDNTIYIWLDKNDRLHIRLFKVQRCYSFMTIIENSGMIEVVAK